ncbi:hypothetical protein BN946_scf184585.g2 [Trametes cinnabarina]|uniref:Uncharacterized protein n=1 Tax=Pycnoporus cinnabarinus TaxID=5643 RepID=A0A060STY4_PYCCI|nr:hypothetical protein BN946_scf184585.g2 [Trametes cinnabarina]
MASFFQHVFGCCIRRRLHLHNPEEPDENTPFIPPSDDAPPPRTYTIDHERMRERLGTIVRSKEGKMVNVNQPLPFNLHGHGRAPVTLPSGSLSTNTTPPRPSSSAAHDTITADSSTATVMMHTPRLPSYSPSRDPSPSIQTSRSTSSLHPGDASYLPPDADPDAGVRRPILNVRLVRAGGRRSSGGRPRPGLTFERGRQGRSGDVRARDSSDEAEDWNNNGKGKTKSGINGTHVGSTVATAGADSDSVPRDTFDTGALGYASGDAPNGTSALDLDIKIDDVGNIAESWGD